MQTSINEERIHMSVRQGVSTATVVVILTGDLAIFQGQASAQSQRIVRGTVQDPSRAAPSGARVTAPSSGDQFSSLTTVTQQVKHEKFDQYEIGVKWDVAPTLTVTTAV
jgi:hypothetical protein